jgi:hypothetical protein
MLEFCLRQMNPDGSFKFLDEDTIGSSFLFPVSLLNELGYFRPSNRFWTSDSFPEGMAVAAKIERRIRAMGLTDPESRKVLRRFKEARLERLVRWLAGIGLLLFITWVSWRYLKAKRVGLNRSEAHS